MCDCSRCRGRRWPPEVPTTGEGTELDTNEPDAPRPAPGPAEGSRPASEPADDAGFVATARGLWKDERVEIVATILLSAAVVLSAWAAYQATRWSGEQANNYAQSAALRATSGRHGTAASRQIQIDVATFIAWVQAKEQGQTSLADILRTRFRAEFVVPFNDWLASAPGDASGVPPGTPFDQPTYVLAEQTAADAILVQADAALAEAQSDNQISDNFVLTAVLFASVLFFAGTAAKFRPQWLRWAMISVACFVFAIGLVVEFSLPQNVGF